MTATNMAIVPICGYKLPRASTCVTRASAQAVGGGVGEGKDLRACAGLVTLCLFSHIPQVPHCDATSELFRRKSKAAKSIKPVNKD